MVYKSPSIQPKVKTKEPAFTFDYFLCFVSFLSILLNNQFGMYAVLGFIAPWGWVFLRNRNTAFRSVMENWPLLLLPACAVLSTAWSDDHSWTMKASVELTITVLVGILAGTRVKPRYLITALLTALIIIAVASMITTRDALLNAAPDQYIAGIFGSKNQFSAAMSLLLLTATAVFINNQYAILFRVMAFVALLFTPMLLYFGNSLGTIIAVIASLSAYMVTQYIKRFPKGLRTLTFFVMFALFLSAMIIFFLADIDTGHILNAMGKDASLTGRTYLWNHALQYISERPIFGTGYGAFWRVDNPRAQLLWYASHVKPGPGFNFHDEYLEILVEMGVIGFSILVGLLFMQLRKAYALLFAPARVEQSFALILFIFYFVRTPVEVNIVGQFDIGMVMFCLLWIYMKPTPREEPEKTYIGNFMSRGQPKIFSP